MMNLLWLGDPKSFDVALVGGKAANLSRLARMYNRLPDGFSLPVTVMDKAGGFLKHVWRIIIRIARQQQGDDMRELK